MKTKLLSLDTKRRNAILNAALKEFASKGFDHASTNVIAKEANISKPLLFHYVANKQELFLVVYDYFYNLLMCEYYERVNYEEHELIDRLHHSFLLQLELLKEYPWIFEFQKLSTDISSSIPELQQRYTKRVEDCFPNLLTATTTTKFKPEFNGEELKQIVIYACSGFSDQIIEKIQRLVYSKLDDIAIKKEINDFFFQLKYIFYDTSEN